MYGNLISNRQLRNLITSKEIAIEPFEEKAMKGTAYTLRPGRVLRRKSNGKWASVHSFVEDPTEEFILEPEEYVVVEVLEHIRILSHGIVGRFVTASTNIENGILVVSGQIDSRYGAGGEGLRVGVKNMFKDQNRLKAATRLTHVEFFDLRGTSIDPIRLSSEDQLVRAVRKYRGYDDGPVDLDDDE